MNLMSAVLDDGDEVLIPAPFGVSYPDMALMADASPVIVPADDGHKISPEQLANFIPRQVNIHKTFLNCQLMGNYSKTKT